MAIIIIIILVLNHTGAWGVASLQCHIISYSIVHKRTSERGIASYPHSPPESVPVLGKSASPLTVCIGELGGKSIKSFNACQYYKNHVYLYPPAHPLTSLAPPYLIFFSSGL